MIALRRSLERAAAHRWIGPLVLIAVALLLALTLFHAHGDHAVEAGAVGCVLVLVLVAPFALPAMRRGPATHVVDRGGRSPPAPFQAAPRSRSPARFVALPLRQ